MTSSATCSMTFSMAASESFKCAEVPDPVKYGLSANHVFGTLLAAAAAITAGGMCLAH